jgi:DNA-directed RNA polymerase subunit M/transcription elongation factor TFIIS
MKRTFFITAFALFTIVGSARAMEMEYDKDDDINISLSVTDVLKLLEQPAVEVVPHQEVVKESNATVLVNPILQQEQKFMCPSCSYEATGTSDLRKHIRDKHELCTYWCLHCDNQFKTRAELVEHCNNLPTNTPNFICKNTQKSFTTLKEYRSHHAQLRNTLRRNKQRYIGLYLCKSSPQCTRSFDCEIDRFKHEIRKHKLHNCRLLVDTRK